MTARALSSCALGTMWTNYEPTPLTRKYLVDEGYIKINKIALLFQNGI